MTDRKNWRTRLAIQIEDTDGEVTEVTPVDSLNITLNTSQEVVDSTEDQNLGYIKRPPKFSFSMNIKPIGDAVLNITALQLNGKEFNIITQVSNGFDDWSFYEEGLTLASCTITNSTPSSVNSSGAPSASFSGNALAIQVAGKSFSTYPENA